jgi:ribosomal protein S12 methylthiotransferase accessory factor
MIALLDAPHTDSVSLTIASLLSCILDLEMPPRDNDNDHFKKQEKPGISIFYFAGRFTMGKDMKVTFPGGTRVDASYRGYVIETDQPVYQGGGGSAPAPFDLFLASLATCAGWYVLSFCQQRNIPLDGASVVLETERDPQAKMISKIILNVNLPPEFPEKYKGAVVKAINLCAVKKHMEDPPSFSVITT